MTHFRHKMALNLIAKAPAMLVRYISTNFQIRK